MTPSHSVSQKTWKSHFFCRNAALWWPKLFFKKREFSAHSGDLVAQIRTKMPRIFRVLREQLKSGPNPHCEWDVCRFFAKNRIFEFAMIIISADKNRTIPKKKLKKIIFNFINYIISTNLRIAENINKKIKPSILSNKPPWPGRIFPLSLTLFFLLK